MQFNPSTGEKLGEIESTDISKLPDIFKKAKEAQQTWSKFSFSKRATFIEKMRKYLVDNSEEISKIISESTGKTRTDALQTEVLPGTMACKWYSSNAEYYLKPQSVPMGNLLFGNKGTSIQFDPVGIVGIISPWNYPFSIPFGEVIMGLMAGNAIILKVASNVTLVGQAIDNIIKAGNLPEGLFTHLVCSGSKASKEMLKNNVNKIFFTGSVAVGKTLMKDASETLTPLSLELGGNDPAVVLKDANLEKATNCICWAGLQNAGQSCAGIERVYVQKEVYEEFKILMIKKIKSLRHGSDKGDFKVDIGSLTTKSQFNTVDEQVNEALKSGAKIIAQSKPVGDVSSGFFYPATLLEGVTHQMKIMRDETFGPVLPIMKFDSIEEGIELANDSDLALTASVYSEDSIKAHQIANKLVAGMVTINDHLYTHGMSENPWGGPKLSGLGRTHGELGLKEMCNAKAINWERLPGVQRNLWWYPQSSISYQGMLNALKLANPNGIGDLISSVTKVTPFALNKMFTKWDTEHEEIEPKNLQMFLLMLIVGVILLILFIASKIVFK
eukprot:gene5596-9411_t